MHFLSVDDVSKEQINEIFHIANDITKMREEISLKEDTTLALLFEKPSTRTRLSFEVAMAKLGGRCIYIDSKSSQMSRGESLADTARVMSLYVDFIAARMFKHEDLLEFAKNSAVPVINALTDREHPTQALADLYTILGKKKKLNGIKIAFVGDTAQNTANSLMLAAVKMGAEMSMIGPRSFAPDPLYITKASEYGVVDTYDNLKEGLAGMDVIYTDTFVSMGNEKEADARRKMLANYQINSNALQYAKRDAIVMHPLPAFRGEEITAEVLEGPKSVVWEQSKNKRITTQAMLVFLSEKEM